MSIRKVYSESSILNFPNEQEIDHRFRAVSLSQTIKNMALTFANQTITEDALKSRIWTLIPLFTRRGGNVDRAILERALIDCAKLTRSDFVNKWWRIS